MSGGNAVHSRSPERVVYDADFAEAVRRGLEGDRKTLPCKYLYDKRGSELFDEITDVEEYYQTRTETGILERSIDEVSALVGECIELVEYGSGSSRKTRILLDRLSIATYFPIDISREHLDESCRALREVYPRLKIVPLAADFTKVASVPKLGHGRRVLFFPGSTIGNFDPEEARELLARGRSVVGDDGWLFIGVDLKKDKRILDAAYNDSQGITASFNLNLLERINRELGGEIAVDKFAHRAFYDERLGRIEMHLESLEDQEIWIGEDRFAFRRGETIHTENSYKYSVDDFTHVAKAAGFGTVRSWTDERPLFSLHLCRAV